MSESKNFIEHIIDKDLEEGRISQVVTRFPPEPNGYLHIGHAKAIITNYTIAKKYGGKFNLRFDDTDPSKEKLEYVEAIREDLLWLGADFEGREYKASSYFEDLYQAAIKLIEKGVAYVDDLSAEQIREYRGTLTEPGKESPCRQRSIAENLDLFKRMEQGEFADGEKVLRAKVDMSSPNMNMRDPVIYRVAHQSHYATGDRWCIYPLYDFAHPLEDAVEGVTHSLCGLEFEDHRPIYNWFLEQLEWSQPPQQIEFGELALTNTIIGKRRIRPLIEEGILDGWDDPRVSTLKGMRRRGYTKEALFAFFEMIGLSKSKSLVDISMLEHALREDLKPKVPRLMTVIDPLKVIITNYPEGKIEWLTAELSTDNPQLGSRQMPFGREIMIEKEDFMEVAPNKKYKRLVLGQEVRLMHAYFIRCDKVVRDEQGQILYLECTYDEKTKSGSGFNERKPRGTIHWVSATEAVPVEVRNYDYLFVTDEQGENRLNEQSLTIYRQSLAEPVIKNYDREDKFQFIRHGYYSIDSKESTEELYILNQAVSLKSSYRPPRRD